MKKYNHVKKNSSEKRYLMDFMKQGLPENELLLEMDLIDQVVFVASSNLDPDACVEYGDVLIQQLSMFLNIKDVDIESVKNKFSTLPLETKLNMIHQFATVGSSSVAYGFTEFIRKTREILDFFITSDNRFVSFFFSITKR